VERINPGETVENTLTMKVKSDAETGSYDLDVEVEYEYDNMSDMDADNGGITETNTISLQAVEDAQAVIENISLGDWGEEPTVNKATGLSFEFYNMGQSTLENVYFTFEGDFQLETGDMSYLGTVEPGTSEYVEPMVIPLVEGNASGTIVVHYEDSTGNEFTINKEIPVTSIQSAEMTEDKDTIEDIPVMSGDTVVTKKSGIPFEFIIILIIAFIAFILLGHFIIKRIQLSKHDIDLSSVDKELKK
jgi:hypothetical protein